MPQHFVASPEWHWYIVWYFFLGGIAGGAYALGVLLRLVGGREDEGAARLAFLVSFPALAICPILLTLDLGKPMRFWHMLIDARTWLPTLKYWSPMSLGAWVLAVFGIFATLSFVEALVLDGRLQHPLARRVAAALSGGFGRLFMIVGACLGLFIAGYTGVLLAVSNQPVWSDTWALGALFLASGLSTAAAAIAMFAWYRRDARPSSGKLALADRYFLIMELVLLAVFFVTLGPVWRQAVHGGWIALWVLVLAGILIPLVMHRSATRSAMLPVLACILVLIGSFALRAVIVLSPQL
jgi:formate-dependent nitrite reductase membrane component NrfD